MTPHSTAITCPLTQSRRIEFTATDAAKAALVMTGDARGQMQMDTLEAMADAWAGEVNLCDMIVNATSPMNLKRHAPEAVRAEFLDRMKAQIFAIAQQAFIEGAVRGVGLVNAELRAAKEA